MSDEITKPPTLGPGDISRVEVGVLSKANPTPGLLRLARVVVQQTPEVSAIFTEARANKHPATWLQERLQPELEKFFPNEGDAVKEVSTFLADEYTQIGDAILLVSSETGRALARITDDDFYTPAEVPRESGNMVAPARRLRPEIEGFVVQWIFDRSQEQEHHAKLLARVPQTALLQEDGDSRLLFTTRAGRRLLTTQIQTALPSLLEGCTGIARAFLDFFPLGSPTAGMLLTPLEVKPRHTHRVPIQDPTARNLRYDVRGSVLAGSATGWVREAAQQLLEKGPKGAPRTVQEALEGRTSGLWVASPNAARVIKESALVRILVLPPGREEVAVYLTEPAGFLEVKSDGFWCGSREVHDRWTVETEMSANLWVDWEKVHVIPLTGVPLSGVSFEIV